VQLLFLPITYRTATIGLRETDRPMRCADFSAFVHYFRPSLWLFVIDRILADQDRSSQLVE